MFHVKHRSDSSQLQVAEGDAGHSDLLSRLSFSMFHVKHLVSGQDSFPIGPFSIARRGTMAFVRRHRSPLRCATPQPTQRSTPMSVHVRHGPVPRTFLPGTDRPHDLDPKDTA